MEQKCERGRDNPTRTPYGARLVLVCIVLVYNERKCRATFQELKCVFSIFERAIITFEKPVAIFVSWLAGRFPIFVQAGMPNSI